MVIVRGRGIIRLRGGRMRLHSLYPSLPDLYSYQLLEFLALQTITLARSSSKLQILVYRIKSY